MCIIVENNEFIVLGVLQLTKLFVYGAIAFIWIVFPAFEITLAAMTTDIVHGTCMRFAFYQSNTMRKTVGFFTVTITYLLPLALMVFCYARIIHGVRSKVILYSHHHKCNYLLTSDGEYFKIHVFLKILF